MIYSCREVLNLTRRGRRPLLDSDRLNRSVLVRVSEAQLALFQRAAGHEPVSSYVRRVALRAAKRETKGGGS